MLTLVRRPWLQVLVAGAAIWALLDWATGTEHRAARATLGLSIDV